jgi:hypothetical protein
MVVQGETIRRGADRVCKCGKEFKLEVLHSAAGYYIGTRCHTVGCDEAGLPYSRESGYYKTKKEAQKALDDDWYER